MAFLCQLLLLVVLVLVGSNFGSVEVFPTTTAKPKQTETFKPGQVQYFTIVHPGRGICWRGTRMRGGGLPAN